MNENTRSTVDLGRSAVARYIQLATLFRRRIQSGQWELGAQIPTVDDLAIECGVARATIRQALDDLEADGLIERFRAKGTFVKRRPNEDLWCAVGTDWAGLLRSRQDARIEVLSEKANVVLDRINQPLGTLAPAYRHVQRKHWREGEPFLLTNVHINEALMDRITRKDLETKTALRLINDVPGLEIIDVRQVLTIGMADSETAAALQIPINAPVAFVYRRAIDKDNVLALAAEGIYRGDIVKFEVKLR